MRKETKNLKVKCKNIKQNYMEKVLINMLLLGYNKNIKKKQSKFFKKDILNDPILKELQDQLKNIDSELTDMVVFF